MRLEFLPPYSPDFNPIELAFSAIKYDIKRNGDYFRSAMASEDSTALVVSALVDTVYNVSAQDARGWFTHCGYV